MIGCIELCISLPTLVKRLLQLVAGSEMALDVDDDVDVPWCCPDFSLVSVPPGSPLIESRENVVSEGNETELTCMAVGSKPAASIRWIKGDEELIGMQKNYGGLKSCPSSLTRT